MLRIDPMSWACEVGRLPLLWCLLRKYHKERYRKVRGRITPEEPNIPDRLLIPEKLYGREREVNLNVKQR